MSVTGTGELESSRPPDDSAASVTRVAPRKRTIASRDVARLLDRLSAQQASLVRAVALGQEDYLENSYYLDAKSGKRIAYEIEPHELMAFLETWGEDPLPAIRGMNAAIAHVPSGGRRRRYLHAAVELEILMDRQCWYEDGQVYRGIPDYLMDGYTDMGGQASPTERVGREKIKIDKLGVADRLTECKRRRIEDEIEVESLLHWYYDRVRRDIQFNESGVEKLSRDFGNESIVLTEYLEKGLGVCRHLSIFFQLYLQEAGIDCHMIKGNLRFYVFKGRHAWNIVELGDRVVLVDVTHPTLDGPFMVTGATLDEVYARAAEADRHYDPTPNDQNFYKIGAPR